MTNSLIKTIALGAALLGAVACKTDPIAGEGSTIPATGGTDSTGNATEATPISNMFSLALSTTVNKALDLIFVIDNSVSMAPKQAKLAEQFPKLIAGLKDPISGKYPDLRVGFLSSDLGTGYSDTCSPQYGDRGLFQMKEPNLSTCGANPGAKWLETDTDGMGNFTGDFTKVFACLAEGMGQVGCGFEQPLQSLNYAFLVDQRDSAGNTLGVSVRPFLRPYAQLGIVLLTDEDDCSMGLNSLVAKLNLSSTEAWSLRCATRGHKSTKGNLPYPTTMAFSADYAAMAARTDFCKSTEMGEVATTCTPLANYKEIANNIKTYKRFLSDNQDVFVAGIFGMPLPDQTSASYKIDRQPSPTVGKPDIFDLWPVCYDPSQPLPEDGTYSRDAAGLGAYPGLRIQAFLNEFPAENRMAASICESDYSGIMARLGAGLFTRVSNMCFPSGFSAGDKWLGFLRVPSGASFVDTPLPICDGTATDCYTVDTTSTVCGGGRYRLLLTRTEGSQPLPKGTTIRFQRG